MEYLRQTPYNLECSFALPSNLLDNLDWGHSTAVNAPQTELAPVNPTSLSGLLSLAIGKEFWNHWNLSLRCGELPHFKESDCHFFIGGLEYFSLESLDLTFLDCYVTAPSGMKYPVNLQRSPDSCQIVCTYKPLECGQHMAFLYRGGLIESCLPIIVYRNYSEIRPHPVVSVDIDIDELTKEYTEKKPWGIACNTNTEQLAVVDRTKHEVLVYGPDGELQFQFGSLGKEPGQFCRPIAVAYDRTENRFFVVDKDNHRVQIFSSSGVFISSFGQRGRREGQFLYPWALDVSKDGRFVIVADSRNGRIQLFDSNGRFLRQYRGDLTIPRGVAFDNSGEHIFVSDFNLHSIFKVDINFRGCSLLVMFKRPSGLAVDMSGNLLVCDSRNNSVKVLDASTGVVLHNIQRIGSNSFNLPLDLTVMRAGHIALLDFNGRIRVF